jgi:hypothetical protein
MASSDFLASLAPKMMVQGLMASYRMVSFPMPVFAPVMTITCPLISLSAVQVVPLAHSLMPVRTASVEETMTPWGVVIQFLTRFTYSIINYGGDYRCFANKYPSLQVDKLRMHPIWGWMCLVLDNI